MSDEKLSGLTNPNTGMSTRKICGCLRSPIFFYMIDFDPLHFCKFAAGSRRENVGIKLKFISKIKKSL